MGRVVFSASHSPNISKRHHAVLLRCLIGCFDLFLPVSGTFFFYFAIGCVCGYDIEDRRRRCSALVVASRLMRESLDQDKDRELVERYLDELGDASRVQA